MTEQTLKQNELLKIWIDDEGKVHTSLATLDFSEVESKEDAMWIAEGIASIIGHIEEAKLYFLLKLRELKAKFGLIKFTEREDD